MRLPNDTASCCTLAVQRGEHAAVLPGEHQDVFDGRINAFLFDHPNATAAQMILIKRIVAADWKLDRLDQVQSATISMNMRHADIDFESNSRQNAEELGNRLIFEPLNRCEGAEWRNEIVQQRIQQRNNDIPKCVKIDLERNEYGVNWMLERLEGLQAMLRFYGFWHYPEKYTVIRLLGKRPEDLIEDSEIGRIFVACNMLHTQAWEFADDCFQTQLGTIGKPMFKDQVVYIEKLIKEKFFKTRLDAFNFLDALATREIARLRELAELLQPLADADCREAPRRAMFDFSPSGIALTRYQGTLMRELRQSVNELMKQVKCDDARGTVSAADFDETEAVETPAAEPVLDSQQNEPISQVEKNPEFTSDDPRRPSGAPEKSSTVDISVARNEPSAAGKGSKTAPNRPR